MTKKQPIQLVLFDLDDTLFDHKKALCAAFTVLQQNYSEVHNIGLKDLVEAHYKQVYTHYGDALDSRVAIQQNRRFRFARMLESVGVIMTDDELDRGFDLYITAYHKYRRPTKGAAELLSQLKTKVKIGVVTNGLREIQHEKLEYLNLERFIDFLLTSEEVGVKKPNPDIFLRALQLAKASTANTLFVGDSWELDILGAYGVGIQSIWLNPSKRLCPDPSITTEVATLELSNLPRLLTNI